MSMRAFLIAIACLMCAAVPRGSMAQVITGSAFALKSSGAASGSGWTLSENGYVGTYVTLGQPGKFSLSINATGSTSNGVNSKMVVSIADDQRSYSLAAGAASIVDYTSPVLPSGTYFIRTQLDNHKALLQGGATVTANTTLTINSATINGATLLNNSTNANALAAANTYIDHFRKGSATLRLNGVAPGTSVRVQLARNAFQFGSYVPGSSAADAETYLSDHPAPGSVAARFQGFVDARFNALVGSNYGKWSNNEASPGVVNMSASDKLMSYAAARNMSVRQHNVIWGNQQPTFVKNSLNDANSTDPSTAASGKAALDAAIGNRLTYYVKGATAGLNTPRGRNIREIDGLNEGLQTGSYYTALGATGVAKFYKDLGDAFTSVGGKAALYLNEFNVLQNAPTSITPSSLYGGRGATSGVSDPYANWYRRHIEAVNNAGLTLGAASNVVSGVGAQYYPTNGVMGADVMQKAYQTLSVEGLPISLTEFGIQRDYAGTRAPRDIMDEAIRMTFGTPQATTFMYWGWLDSASDDHNAKSIMVTTNADGSYSLTDVGKRFDYLFGRGTDASGLNANVDGSNPNPWTTDVTRIVDADGNINFDGFYGEYLVTIGNRTYPLSLVKGADLSALSINVPEPVLSLPAIFATLLFRRVRRVHSNAARANAATLA